MLVVYSSTVARGILTWPQVGDFVVAIGAQTNHVLDMDGPYHRGRTQPQGPGHDRPGNGIRCCADDASARSGSTKGDRRIRPQFPAACPAPPCPWYIRCTSCA